MQKEILVIAPSELLKTQLVERIGAICSGKAKFRTINEAYKYPTKHQIIIFDEYDEILLS
jgi:hypothetical protein